MPAIAAAPDRATFVGELVATLNHALIALRKLPMPIVAAVQGPVAGGGLGLVLAADIVVSSESAKFVSGYAEIGLSPDCGVSALLPAIVGVRRAALLTLTRLTLNATTAREWGLVSVVCPPGELDAQLFDLISELRSRPSRALGMSARLLRRASENSYERQVCAEADCVASLSATPESVARLASFIGTAERTGRLGAR